MSEQPHYRRYRKFLEPINGSADSYVSVNGLELKITDCTRSVELFFSQSEPAALAKLERLRAALDALEENIREHKRTGSRGW